MVQLALSGAIAASTAAASRFAASGLARGCLRAFFGEIGDKTFFVTLVLTAWCPWQGPRDLDLPSAPHRLLVLLAALAAASAHAVMAASVRVSKWSDWSDQQNWAFELSAGFLFALLSLRAYLTAAPAAKFGGFGSGVAGSFGDGVGNETEPLLQSPQYNKDAFTFPSPPVIDGGESADGGGASADGKKSGVGSAMSADGLLGEPPSGALCSAFSAVLVTAVAVFLAEAEDKSWYALVDGGRQGTDLLLGAFIGFVPAVSLAVFLGTVLWWQLEANAIRLVAMLAFLSLSFISFSQAMLHLNVLDIGLTTNSSAASGALAAKP